MKKKVTVTTTTTEEIIEDNSLLVNMILDMSGSMMNVWDSVISGYNEYIKGQKVNPDTKISLTLFDTVIEKPYVNKNINEVPELTKDVYKPRGGTALLDAIASSIRDTEKLNPTGKVLICIQTDGQENSSTKENYLSLAELIKAKEALGWAFVFLGSGIDSWKVSQQIGISTPTAYNYTASAAGTRLLFQNLSNSTINYANTGDLVSSTANLNDLI